MAFITCSHVLAALSLLCLYWWIIPDSDGCCCSHTPGALRSVTIVFCAWVCLKTGINSDSGPVMPNSHKTFYYFDCKVTELQFGCDYSYYFHLKDSLCKKCIAAYKLHSGLNIINCKGNNCTVILLIVPEKHNRNQIESNFKIFFNSDLALYHTLNID